MLRALPSAKPEALVVAATGRRVVGWRMGEDFEITLPDSVEVRDVEVESEAFDPSGAPAFKDVLVDHRDGTKTRERQRATTKTRRRERVVLSHGGTVGGPKGAWLVCVDPKAGGWHVVGASREARGGPWTVDERAVLTAAEFKAGQDAMKAAEAKE